MHYFVTGHTGFKGAWLTLLLKELGHEVTGYSLNARPGSLFARGELARCLSSEFIGDIRDCSHLAKAIVSANPDRVIHLAAQPLVQYSYSHPRETYEVNVFGTLNLLESVAVHMPTLIVTTDKVYTPSKTGNALLESAPLGGGPDPYSASKAMADILTSSWIASNAGSRIGIVRAGNVIGGGDDSQQRLIPDLLSAFLSGKNPVLRYPGAVRPWQHVLDCLEGYLRAIEFVERESVSGVWNIGPAESDNQTVLNVMEEVAEALDTAPRYEVDSSSFMPETGLLSLNSESARSELGWKPRWNFQDAIHKTVEWEKVVINGGSPRETTQGQIQVFLEGN